ncbi:hypothetical protein WN943_006658 [Citrus x changshan-huyou]
MVENILAKGGIVSRELGLVKGGTTHIVFVKDLDGWIVVGYIARTRALLEDGGLLGLDKRPEDDLYLKKRVKMRRWLFWHHKKVPALVKPEVQKEAPPIEVPALTLDELKEKTNNFGSKALFGEGSYGRVYYANLKNGKAMAVKKLDVSSEP